ncbi:MAG: hypothetical protein IBX50_04065 [Marinospirillum sp.]|uniref:hypothetical protein n=1 Tax=Marinospirillum sp. TaxID=2183934 RepID=UPI0019F7B130|nr:hypothetical protein [Marinospirillum sp.]MBE0505881.1 hypothetical protein [Marinospirillum sp.]
MNAGALMSAVIFGVVFYFAGVFAAFSFDLSAWPVWLRAVTVFAAIAAWLADIMLSSSDF